MKNPKNATLPHCPGDTQVRPCVASINATSAKFVGLNKCLPRHRNRNLLPTAATTPAVASQRLFVRSRRHNDNPEMRALRGSKLGKRDAFVPNHCVASAH